MNELEVALQTALNNEVYRCVLSNSSNKDCPYKKIVLTRLEHFWQLEKYTQTQVFHEKAALEAVQATVAGYLTTDFRQYNGWDGQREHSIRISKAGKVLATSSAAAQQPQRETQHNRTKNYILAQGEVIPPLVDMGIFTKDGQVVNSMYDKYRQINRFIELVDDAVCGLKPATPLTVIDFGCGKSYLTFVLYHYLTVLKGLAVRMIGLDLKEDVIANCNRTAARYGYDGLCFEQGDISGYQFDGRVDMVITLHACNTATDYALLHAVQWGAGMIFSVPCCQHELNGQMQSQRMALLTRYGIVKERTAALLTDAIRANLLECCGYKTQLLEFIEMEHTPKNILIR
ncbi:MAG: SAM-dependent methyltransferase, partial [Angelakisella sp.]